MTPRTGPRPADLIRRTQRALEFHYALAHPVGLSLERFAVLAALKCHGPHTTQELIGLTGMAKTAIYTITKRLKREGLVEGTVRAQKRPGQDPLELAVTMKGRRAVNQAETHVWNSEVQVLSRLSPEERSRFLDLLAITAFSGPKL